MTQNNSKRWPEDYVQWTGDLQDLITTSNEVVKSLGYTPDLTERTVRHYQHKNMVGRGVKQGRQAFFDMEDLAKVVATKTLVKQGWTLDHASDLLTYQTTSSEKAPLLTQANPAVSVVAELLASSQGHAVAPATRVTNQMYATQVTNAPLGSVSLQGAHSPSPPPTPSNLSLLRSLTQSPPAPSVPTPSTQVVHHVHPLAQLHMDQTFWMGLSDHRKVELQHHLSTLSSFLSTLSKEHP